MAEGAYAGGRRKPWNPSWHPALALAVPCSSWLSAWPVGEVPPLCKADLALLEGLELGGSVMSPPALPTGTPALLRVIYMSPVG